MTACLSLFGCASHALEYCREVQRVIPIGHVVSSNPHDFEAPAHVRGFLCSLLLDGHSWGLLRGLGGFASAIAALAFCIGERFTAEAWSASGSFWSALS